MEAVSVRVNSLNPEAITFDGGSYWRVGVTVYVEFDKAGVRHFPLKELKYQFDGKTWSKVFISTAEAEAELLLVPARLDLQSCSGSGN